MGHDRGKQKGPPCERMSATEIQTRIASTAIMEQLLARATAKAASRGETLRP